MITKLTSIHAVISKVVRDLGLGDDEIRWQDMIEWASEGLLFIGSYYQFQEKEAVILIEDYKGVLPCDFYKSIRYLDGVDLGDNLSGGPYWDLVNKALKESGYQDTSTPCTVENGDCYDVIDPISFQKLQLVQYNKVGYFNGFSGNLRRAGSNLIGQGNTYSSRQKAYSIDFDTVTTSFRYGCISLRYLAIPVDDSGYPLVPDDVAFHEALMWRIAEKMAMRGHTFKNPQLNDFEVSKFYWNKYCMQARGNANAPDNDTIQKLSNIWLTLIPKYNRYYNDFNDLGNPQL